MSLFVFIISLLIVAQHVSGNHVPIIKSWQLRDVIALCWYVPWLQEGGQVGLVGSASMDGFVKRTHPWHLVGFSYPLWITMHGQPHIRFNSLQPFEFAGIIQQKMKQHTCHLIPPWRTTTVQANESSRTLNYVIGCSGVTNTITKMFTFPNIFLVSLRSYFVRVAQSI